jgi:flagellar assembly factor FliW
MKFRTTRFGELELPDSDAITLPEGILGFPDSRRFVLLEHDAEGTPFKWLQAVENPSLAFVIMDPHLLVSGYEIVFDEEAIETLGSEKFDEENFAAMVIVNIPHGDPIHMTANLRAPIIVRLDTRMGQQIVLANEDYPIQHRIFQEIEEEPAS